MKLSEVAIARPVFTTMMMAALLVLGLFSYSELPVEMFPKVDFPFTTVVTVYPGASPETVETELSKRIEDVVNEISGVRNIISQSRESYSLVFIEFQLEKNSFEATNEVREKVAGIRGDLPDDIEEPVVSSWDPNSEPILSITISGKRTPKEVTEFAKTTIKRRLETLPGVGSVELVGGLEREIQVAVDPIKMESYGVTVDDVRNAVRAANLEIPGGRVEEASREYLVRVMGRLDRVAQFENVIVKNVNGTQVLLRDVARVADTTIEQRSLSRYNGEAAVSLGVSKQSGANTVELADAARAMVAKLQEEVPPDVKLTIVEDNSTFIKDSIHEIETNIEFGTLLAIIVIFLFLLDIRPTFIAGLAIPISLIATFTIMKALGFTINFMTLLALSLAVGILIDDAIVVIENIYRHIDLGEPARKAAFAATKEIGLAVMATTFSIVVVFVPVAFMQGIVGRFFYQFGMSVAFAVTISLFVAFTLTPMLSSRWLHKEHEETPETIRQRRGLGKLWGQIRMRLGFWNRAFEAMKPSYVRLLAASLRHRGLVVLVAIASFVFALWMGQFVGQEFVPETDEGKIYVSISTPPGTPLAQTSERIAEIEKIVRALPEVAASYVVIGSGNNPVTEGRVLFQLVDKEIRDFTAKELMDSVRTLISIVPGVKVAVSSGGGEGGGDKQVEISVRGENLDELRRLAHELQAIYYRTPGATDIDNTLEEGKPELQLVIDRAQADDLGLNLAAIPLTVRALVEGEVVTRFKDREEEYDVRMRLDERYRSSVDDVGRILVESGKDVPGKDPFLVPLSRVAKISRQEAIGEYNRLNRMRHVTVNCNTLTGYFPGTIVQHVMTEAVAIPLPPGYSIAPVGEAEIMAESFQNIFKALFLSVVFIYLMLASQYESFTDPFSIMLSLPMSLVGAILALQGSSFSIMSLIGIVMLMGLVTKNAILLIDFVKQARDRGMGRTEAILEAGPVRLRPILMTSLAMVFGMLPLALGLGAGAEIRSGMARAVIGGLISSTLLTLVVVPVVYTLIDDLASAVNRKGKSSVVVQTEGAKPD